MKILKCSMISLFCVFNLAACGDDAEDAIAAAFDGNVKPQTALNVDGDWTSGCINGAFGEQYGRRIINLNFLGNTFLMQVEDYQGTDCVKLIESSTKKGTFSQVKSYNDNTYLVEYRIPINEQVSQLLSQKIQINNDSLLTSEISGAQDSADSATVSILMVPQ